MSGYSSKYKCVEAGNWYTEYKCTICGEHIVEHADGVHVEDLHPIQRCGVHGYFCQENMCPRC